MQPHDRIPFEGLTTSPASRVMPAWYQAHTGTTTTTPPPFMSAIASLPTAEKRRAAYWDDERGEWVETARHEAVINPRWLGRDPDTATDPPDACWNIPTRQYDIVLAEDAYRPLVAAIVEAARGDDAFDHQAVYGEIRTYRHGGEVHIDLIVPHYRVAEADIHLGIQTGYDFYGTTRLYAEAIAANGSAHAIMRSLDQDRNTRRHVKPRQGSGTTVAEVTDWWGDQLDRLDTVATTLFEVIHDAMAYELDLSDLQETPRDVYTALGVPSAIADTAESTLTSFDHATAWDYYTALTATLTADYDAKDDGGAFRRQVRIGNQLLFRPAHAHNNALTAFRRRARGQHTLEGDRIAERIQTQQRSVQAAMDDYESIRAKVKSMLAEASAGTP